MFTIEMLTIVAQHTPIDTLNNVLSGLNNICDKYNLNTQLRRAHFLAQTAAESGGFTALSENLNYSAATLMRLWPNRFNQSNVDQYANNPEAIANITYAGRYGNGNEESGDGWTYRGRGLLQITFKSNYELFANSINMSLSDVVDYCATLDGAVESAAWFWASNNCNKYADANDITGLTKAINGGLTGLDVRTANFNRVYPVC